MMSFRRLGYDSSPHALVIHLFQVFLSESQDEFLTPMPITHQNYDTAHDHSFTTAYIKTLQFYDDV